MRKRGRPRRTEPRAFCFSSHRTGADYDRRARVRAAFFAAAERLDLDRLADALRPPFREAERFSFLPRPEPLFLPPPLSLFTVAQARRAASFEPVPRFSYPSSMCSALRFCLLVYFDLLPRAMMGSFRLEPLARDRGGGAVASPCYRRAAGSAAAPSTLLPG